MIRIHIIPLLCTLAAFPYVAKAQSAKGVSIRVFAVALNKDQGPVCTLVEKTRGGTFELTTTTLSDNHPVGSREFTLIAANAPADAQPKPVATIRLPELGSDFRVILIPSPDGSYKSVVVRGDDSKFAHGDLFFLNLSTHRMLGALGRTRLDLKPGSQEIIRPEASAAEKFIEVKFASHDADRLLPLTNTCWPVVRDNRSFVIFYNGTSGRPTYRAVDEFMAIATAATN